MTNNNTIGEQIQKLRNKNYLTQEELAEKIGVSKQTISNWETGLKSPRMGAIQKLSDLFNVSKSYIIDNEESTNTKAISIFNFEDDEQELLNRYRRLSQPLKDAVISFTIDLEKKENNFKKRKSEEPILDLATNLSQSSIISVTELANYTIRTIENTGNVRKQVQDLLRDCKIFIDEEKTNTAEFINVRRKIYETLLPLGMFIVAYEENITTIEEFSKHFSLSREFLIEAIGYYATFKGSIFEHNHHLIDLSNIPLEYSNIDEVNNAQIIVTNTNKKEAPKKKGFFK